MSKRKHHKLPAKHDFREGVTPRLIVAIGCALFIFIFFKNAWVDEDAFSMFRSYEQFYAGNGPTWNSYDRVQIYTSVLWYWLQVLPGYVVPLFYNAIFGSALFCGCALYFAFRIIGRANWWLVTILALTASKGFMNYTSSGMENPLSYFILSLFLFYYVRVFSNEEKADKFSSLTKLTIIVSLVPLVRHDLALLVAPAYAFAWLRSAENINSPSPWKKRLTQAVLAALPLLLWSLFALFYYGNPLPNTALAKLYSLVPRSEVVAQGFGWIYITILNDTITAPLLLLCGLCLLKFAPAHLRFIGAGGYLFFAYCIWVGGDYMLSRFLGPPLFFVIIATAHVLANKQWLIKRKNSLDKIQVQYAAVFFAVYALLYPSPLRIPLDYDNVYHHTYGIISSHEGRWEKSSLFAFLQNGGLKNYFAEEWVKAVQSPPPKSVVMRPDEGFIGYLADLDTIILGYGALSDAFIARLPFSGYGFIYNPSNLKESERNPLGLPLDPKGRYWSAGHLYRIIPQGYPEALVNDSRQLKNPELQQFWEKVKFVTRGNLFNWERVKTAILLNAGHYNHLLKSLEGKKSKSPINIIYSNDGNKDHWLIPFMENGELKYQGYPKRPSPV